MLKALQQWWWHQKFSFHSETVKLKYRLGRLYVFRDRPDWFVEASAALLKLARSNGEDAETMYLLQQAADEWALRKRRGVQSYWSTKESEQ